MNKVKFKYVTLFAIVGLAAALLYGLSRVLAATAPNLGSTSTYAVVSSTFTNSNTAPQTIINGDVCYTTAPVTPPLLITGATNVPCDSTPPPPNVVGDQGLALAALNAEACTSLGAGAVALDSVIIAGNAPGTIPPGCYSSGGAMNVTLSTTVTLDLTATGGVGSVWIFRPGGALNTGANSIVALANGASACDVFWAPVGATTLGANAALSLTPTFVGTIIDDAGITIGHFANLTGRALAAGGTVTTDANTITVPVCQVATTTSTSIPGATTTTSTSIPGATTTTSTSLPPGVTTTTTLPPGATIPAAGNWGMVILGLAFLGAIAWMVRARRSLR